MAYSFDRPRHGFEGINNGGEIYGSDSNAFYEFTDKLDGDRTEMAKLLEGIDMSVDELKIVDKDFKEKKEKIINILNNHFGSYNVFPEVTNVSDEDFIKIIELYEQKASVGGKDPWHYLYILMN